MLFLFNVPTASVFILVLKTLFVVVLVLKVSFFYVRPVPSVSIRSVSFLILSFKIQIVACES